MDTSDKSYLTIEFMERENVSYVCPPHSCNVQEQQIIVYNTEEGSIIGYPLHTVARYQIDIVSETH